MSGAPALQWAVIYDGIAGISVAQWSIGEYIQINLLSTIIVFVYNLKKKKQDNRKKIYIQINITLLLEDNIAVQGKIGCTSAYVEGSIFSAA